MASIIRIKRSSGTAKPASLNWGEMAYVTGVGQFGGVNQVSDKACKEAIEYFWEMMALMSIR